MRRNTAAQSALKVGIIGGGYSGTAVAAMLARQAAVPLDITLFDKAGEFGVGEAYRTTFPYHLLNVRAKDMSAFADEPTHFVDWLLAYNHRSASDREAVDLEFVPRYLYCQYLQHILNEVRSLPVEQCRLTLEKKECIDLFRDDDCIVVVSEDGRTHRFDKVVLAIGNGAAIDFPFAVDPAMKRIPSSWNYQALRDVAPDDPVMIVGTGLSMIDAVLTLYHQGHRGKIHAVSRHGLLPLPHDRTGYIPEIQMEPLPTAMRRLAVVIHRAGKAQAVTGDWRSVVNAVRGNITAIWQQASLADKKLFLRHLMPYWNIHRHRVHIEINQLLEHLKVEGQLCVTAGRVQAAGAKQVLVKQRGSGNTLSFDVSWLINCMGPPSSLAARSCPLVQSLQRRNLVSFDPLSLGFAVSSGGALKDAAGHVSKQLYTLGPPARGEYWECTAVPDIRHYCKELTENLLSS